MDPIDLARRLGVAPTQQTVVVQDAKPSVSSSGLSTSSSSFQPKNKSTADRIGSFSALESNQSSEEKRRALKEKLANAKIKAASPVNGKPASTTSSPFNTNAKPFVPKPATSPSSSAFNTPQKDTSWSITPNAAETQSPSPPTQDTQPLLDEARIRAICEVTQFATRQRTGASTKHVDSMPIVKGDISDILSKESESLQTLSTEEWILLASCARQKQTKGVSEAAVIERTLDTLLDNPKAMNESLIQVCALQNAAEKWGKIAEQWEKQEESDDVTVPRLDLLKTYRKAMLVKAQRDEANKIQEDTNKQYQAMDQKVLTLKAQGDISTLEWPLILDTLKIKQVAISQTPENVQMKDLDKIANSYDKVAIMRAIFAIRGY